MRVSFLCFSNIFLHCCCVRFVFGLVTGVHPSLPSPLFPFLLPMCSNNSRSFVTCRENVEVSSAPTMQTVRLDRHVRRKPPARFVFEECFFFMTGVWPVFAAFWTHSFGFTVDESLVVKARASKEETRELVTVGCTTTSSTITTTTVQGVLPQRRLAMSHPAAFS